MWPPDSCGFDLSQWHHAVLETSTVLLSTDDNISRQFRPQILPDKMFNVFIHNKGLIKTVRCDFVGLLQVGVHTSTDLW